jgi:putative membrane protein
MVGGAWYGIRGPGDGRFLGVVIVGVILLIRSVSAAHLGLWHDTPLNLLKRRYASGQITREQYEQMKKDLEQGH